jgi:hypothetical protein
VRGKPVVGRGQSGTLIDALGDRAVIVPGDASGVIGTYAPGLGYRAHALCLSLTVEPGSPSAYPDGVSVHNGRRAPSPGVGQVVQALASGEFRHCRGQPGRGHGLFS